MSIIKCPLNLCNVFETKEIDDLNEVDQKIEIMTSIQRVFVQIVILTSIGLLGSACVGGALCVSAVSSSLSIPLLAIASVLFIGLLFSGIGFACIYRKVESLLGEKKSENLRQQEQDTLFPLSDTGATTASESRTFDRKITSHRRSFSMGSMESTRFLLPELNLPARKEKPLADNVVSIAIEGTDREEDKKESLVDVLSTICSIAGYLFLLWDFSSLEFWPSGVAPMDQVLEVESSVSEEDVEK